MTSRKSIYFFAVVLNLLVFVFSTSGQNVSHTFPSGTAIIDMGSATPTVANSLKPYGLVYMMLKDRNVPVYWSINQNKPKDGIDFSYNGKDYKGGVFIVSKEYFRGSVVNMLNNYAAQGVIIDYTTSSLTLDNLTKLSFSPSWTMDKNNGVIGVGYLNAAGIPSSAFNFKQPSELGNCDDIFVLPHADPTWEIHNNLYFWNKNFRGNLWVGCNAVSILEGISKDTTILGVPTNIKMNFLSTNGLVTYFNHQRAIAPFQAKSPTDYLAQYVGVTDGAQQNGAEGIYLPKIGSTWNASTKIITSAPTHADIPSLSAGPAVKNIYGRAFNDATRGYVAYQASHNMAGTGSNYVNAQRIFLNFSFFSLGEKGALSVSNDMTGYTTEMKAGQLYAGFNGTAVGTGGPFTYQWLVSIGGTFSNPNSAITSYTPDPTITTTTTGVLTCIATDVCGRKSITSIGITILKGNPPLIANAIAKDVPGDCPVNTTSFNVFDSNVDPEAGARTLTAVTVGSGSTTFSADGTINYTSAQNFFGSVAGTYTISNGTTSTTGNITLTVGLTSLAPSVTTDAATVLQDKVTEINVLGNDKNNPAAANGNLLFIKDITQKPASNAYVYINSNGTVSYVTKNTGTDNFKYLACNDVGYCSEAQVNITISAHGCGAGLYKATTDVAAVTGVLTFVPSKDTYISSDAGFVLNGTLSVIEQTNYGNANSMIVNMTANQDHINAPLMHFDLSALSSTTTINSAQFSVTVSSAFSTLNDGSNNVFPVTLTRLKKSWTEANVTWEKYNAGSNWTDLTDAGSGVIYNDPNTKNGTDFVGANAVGNTLTPTTADPTITVANGTTVALNSSLGTNVTNLVKYWTANPANNFGMIMTGSLNGALTTDLDANFYSKEGAGSNSQKPSLIVNYNITDAVIATCTAIPANYKPVAYPDAGTTNSNADVLIDVLNNDANYYAHTNNLTVSQQPTNGTATVSTNKILYHPNGSFVGVDTLIYQITDATNGEVNTAKVRVNVKRVAPTIVGDLATTASGTAVTITVTANDTDPQGAIDPPVITVNPKNGSAVVVGNNIVYTPSVGFTGTDVLTYKRSSVSNSICVTALSASAQVTITVTNQPPVATNDAVSTFTCAPIEIKVLTNDTDPEGTPLTPSIISTTLNGTLTITANNTLLYTPNNGYTGADQFTYKVTDAASLLSAVAATVTITVSGVPNTNIAPVAVSDNENTLINQSLNSDVLLNDSDPNGDVLTINISAVGLLQPANGTITLLGNNMIRYTPNANFVGTDSYEYQICDSHPGCGGNTSLCAKGLVTIKVAAIPIQVSGTIWDDADGSAAGTFNNIQNGAEFGTNAFGGVYVYLVDNTNTIIDQTSVDNNGGYTLVNVPPNTANLKMILSAKSLNTGDVLTTGSLPSGFTNTSPITKTFTTVNTNITGSDFGIGQLPVANSYTFPIQLNTNPGSLTLDPAKFSGSDPDGTISYIKFTSFPSNIASLTLNGTTYTSGNFPAVGVTLTATGNALTGTGTVSIVPAAGSVTPVLSFIVIDNSGAVSPITGTVNVPLYIPLTAGVIATNYSFCGNGIPSTFTSTTDAAGGRATINYQWEMSSVVGFGTLTSISGATSSTYTHSTSITATTYFRRKVSTTLDAALYSNILTVTINPLPAAPAVTGATSNTSPAALTLSSTANGATGDETVDWYADPTGGAALQLGASTFLTRTYLTPALTNTTNYYPQARNVTTGCISQTRTIVTATISGTLNPGAIGSDQSGCGTFTPTGLTSSTDAIGLPSITYQWQSSTDNSTFNNIGGAISSTYSPVSISTTTYYRRVATSGGTSKNSNVVTVTSNPLPTAPSGAALNGSRTGTGTVTLTGTVAAGVIIDWYNNSSGNGLLLAGSNSYTTPSISQTTTYYPLARNIVTGCLSARATAIATVNPVLAGGIVAAISPSVCGDATPSAFTSSTNPSGGTGTYIYQWQSSTESSSSGFVDIAGANASTYTPATPITTTTYYRRGVSTTSDAVVYSNVVTITRYALPIITTTPTNSAISTGTSVTINASGADTYIWSPATSLSTTNTAAVTSTPASTITYTVTGTSTNGCLSSTTMTISVIDAGTISGTQTNCGTFTPTTFTSTTAASGGAPITYQWQSSTDNVTFSNITGATSTTYSPGSISVTTYYRRVATFNGSSFNSNTLTATVKAIPTVNIGSNSPICVNGTLNLTSSGGGTYSWSGPNSYTSTSQNPSISNVTTAAGGTYSLTVTGASGCTAFTTTAVTVNPLPTVTITPNSATIVTGITASLTASGAGTYSWSPATGLSATNTATVTASPLTTTMYTVTGTITTTGCVSTSTVTVTFATINPGVIGSNQSNCGAFTPTTITETTVASGAAPITYQWQSSTDNITFNNIAGATNTTYSPGSVSVTTYYRRAAIFNGASFNSNTITETVNTFPSVTKGSNSPICVNGTLNLTSSGGGTYSWSGPNSFTSTSQNPSITNVTTAAGGTYSLTVTGANGCTVFTTTAVTVNPLPVVTVTPNAATIVSGTSATLTASGAGTYSWSPATGLSATNTATVTASPLTTTMYTVTGTITATGCVSTSTVTVTLATINPGVIGSDQSNCGAFTPTTITETTVASGAAPITYQWQSSTDNITFNNITGATNTTYSPGSISVTTYYRRVAIFNGASFNSNSITATVKNFPSVTRSSNSPICANGTLSLTSSGGGTYSWSGPNNFLSTTQNPSIVGATTAAGGTYSLTVTGANGCTTFTSTLVVVNTIPTVSVTPTTITIIPTGTATLTASGTANTYAWTPSTGLSATNTAVVTVGPMSSTTTYTVTGTITATGCAASATVTVTVKNLIDAIDDDYSGTEINGAKGGSTPVVITNDKLNNAAFNISVVNLTLVSNGGIGGLTFSPTGELIIPANTLEGTYTVTYSICEKANPTNCDQANVLIKIGRGLGMTATAVCINDVPYVQYTVTPNFVTTGNPVTITWLNSDKTIVTAQPVATNQALQAQVLWPGATIDAQGNGTDWPGWLIANGQWIQGADGFEKTRPTAYMVFSVNPTDTIAVSYPPATPLCNSQPKNKPPVPVADVATTPQCKSVTINALANDTDPQSGTLTLSLTSTSTANGGSLTVTGNGVITYTPSGTFTGIDNFTYTATNAATTLTATGTVAVTVSASAANIVVVTPPAGSISSGTSISLTASGSDTYSWSPATGLSATNIATVTASPLVTTTYTVSGTLSSSGCINTQTVIVTVTSPTVLNPGTIGTNQTICIGSTPAAFTSFNAASGGSGAISYQWQSSTDSVNFTNITAATAVTYSAPGVATKTFYRRAASTSVNTTVYSNVVSVAYVNPPVITGITGPCAMPKDSTKTFTVAAAVPAATNYIWTLPSGYTGSSTTNSISVKAGTTNGTISVYPVNGSCIGNTVNYSVSIIDYAQVTITGVPVTAAGTNNNPIVVTIQLFDVNGNKINCSGGIATLCSNYGTFSPVIDKNDGTYTANLTSSANDITICGTVAGLPILKTTKVTFTGPQGSISGNGPILATETPRVTFTMTAGRAPFTVIYRSAKSNKNDTVNNYLSGTRLAVPLIPTTTLYTLVSIIDANLERRDNNFTRDTATIIVVAPKVIITLHADPAKRESDSIWATRLTVKTKNIGDLDLSGSQALLNLKTVFPNPVTFVLDSVTYDGRTITPNKNYDGVNNADLFAKLNQRTNSHSVFTNSNTEAVSYSINETSSVTDGENTSRQIIADRWINTATGETVSDEEIAYDGHSMYMFGALSNLPVNVQADMQLFLHIKPNGYTEPFVMQAVALGTGSTQGATALATSLSNDNNDLSTHPEVTKVGDPAPAIVNLFPLAVIGASMSAGTPVLQPNGTYNVLLSFKSGNYGNLNLQNVQLFLNLSRMIGAPSTFTVVGPVTATGNLIPNPGYNGVTDTSIISTKTILSYKTEGTAQFTINITPNQLSSLYRLQALATGFSDDLLKTVTDLSTDGSTPDPDGNNIPDESVITIIAINKPIPPLVPGTIGILVDPVTRATVPAKGYCATATGVQVVSNSTTSGGTGPYLYQWQSSADNVVFTNIPNATDSIYTTGTLATSTYLRKRVTSDNQVAFTNSVYIQIYQVIKPTITASGPLALPQNGSVTLTSSIGTAYLWSNAAITNAIVVGVATVGTYTVTVTDANGCKAVSDPVRVTPPPPVTINTIYIVGASTNPANSGNQVTGFPGAKINFYLLAAGGVLVPVPNIPTTVGVFTYYVSQTINGMESVLVPYTVTMLDPAKVADLQKVVSKSPELQSDGSFTMAFKFTASNLRSELLDSVKIKDDLSKVFPIITEYSLLDINASGKLKANPFFNGNTQTDLLADGSQLPGLATDSVMVILKVVPNGFTGQLNNTAIQTAKSPFGTFNVTSNDPNVGNGILVRNPTKFIIPFVDIFIPSGFSPNRDGVNDKFVITRPFNTSINMQIFNRWGNAVYLAPDYKNEWDGRGNQPNNILGEELPDGTYYYIVTATNKSNGSIRKFAGFITLKR